MTSWPIQLSSIEFTVKIITDIGIFTLAFLAYTSLRKFTREMVKNKQIDLAVELGGYLFTLRDAVNITRDPHKRNMSSKTRWEAINSPLQIFINKAEVAKFLWKNFDYQEIIEIFNELKRHFALAIDKEAHSNNYEPIVWPSFDWREHNKIIWKVQTLKMFLARDWK